MHCARVMTQKCAMCYDFKNFVLAFSGVFIWHLYSLAPDGFENYLHELNGSTTNHTYVAGTLFMALISSDLIVNLNSPKLGQKVKHFLAISGFFF